VDTSVRAARRSHPDARLRSDARGRHGGIREELAAGISMAGTRIVPMLRPLADFDFDTYLLRNLAGRVDPLSLR
jgi:hypothetical protein